MVGKIHSRKADQAAKPGRVYECGYYFVYSVRVWLLAGPRKCNWPSVTLWSVFQNPVTLIITACSYKDSRASLINTTLSHYLGLGF